MGDIWRCHDCKYKHSTWTPDGYPFGEFRPAVCPACNSERLCWIGEITAPPGCLWVDYEDEVEV